MAAQRLNILPLSMKCTICFSKITVHREVLIMEHLSNLKPQTQTEIPLIY